MTIFIATGGYIITCGFRLNGLWARLPLNGVVTKSSKFSISRGFIISECPGEYY